MIRTLKIGLLTPAWPGYNTPNGIATSTMNLATGLAEIGHLPVIITPKLDGTFSDGIPSFLVPQPQRRIIDRISARFSASATSRRVVARGLIAAVRTAMHEHGLDAMLMEETKGWAELVGKKVPVPIFVHLHGPWIVHLAVNSRKPTRRDMSRLLAEGLAMRTAAGLIAPSRNVLRTALEAYNVEHVPSAIIPNAAHVPDRPADRIDISPPATGDILFVGRFDQIKGGDLVIEAFAAMKTIATLTFVGPDSGIHSGADGKIHIGSALAQLDPETRSRIRYLGRQPRDVVADLRRHHPIALVASRYENFGSVGLEAMAAGQAIVSSNVGGLPEMYEHDVSALLVPPSDAKTMAQALDRLVGDRVLTERLGAAAAARVKKDFSPACVAEQVADFIESTLSFKARGQFGRRRYHQLR